MKILASLFCVLVLMGNASAHNTGPEKEKKMSQTSKEIYLAGGCFWGVQGYFRQLPGILQTRAGYANGITKETRYQIIDRTDHAEAVHIVYDPDTISLKTLLLHFFRIIDPVSINKQGNDIGRQYRTGIYHVDDADLATIHQVMAHVQQNHSRPIAVEVLALNNYMDAEEYHQDYLEKNPNGYCHINLNLARTPLETTEGKEDAP